MKTVVGFTRGRDQSIESSNILKNFVRLDSPQPRIQESRESNFSISVNWLEIFS